jgi:DNA-binding MarR family transcriptional regulator
MHDIARVLGIEAPSVTRTVQELEQAGLIKRRPDPEDKRASHVSLTKKGGQQLAKLQKARRERLSQALKQWSISERRQLAELLQRLAKDISETF